MAELTQSCGAQLTKRHICTVKNLNSYEHLQILWGQVLHTVPPGSATYDILHTKYLWPYKFYILYYTIVDYKIFKVSTKF